MHARPIYIFYDEAWKDLPFYSSPKRLNTHYGASLSLPSVPAGEDDRSWPGPVAEANADDIASEKEGGNEATR